MRELEAIQEKIDSLYERLENIFINEENKDLIESLEIEIKLLEEELIRVTEPTCSNGVIDLYLDENNSCEDEEVYIVRLAGDVQKIGEIQVRFGNIPVYGNIGAHLDEAYRGNGYIGEALDTLSDRLIEKGLTKPILTANRSNLSSIRAIEKFGGVLVYDEEGYKDYNIYEVDLVEKKTHLK